MQLVFLTMMYYLWFAVFVCLSSLANCDETVSGDTLVLVHVMVRHGARTPDSMTALPTDQHKDVTFYPYGKGELNKKGVVSSYQLGKKLKKRYENFFGPRYYPEILEARSSGYSRCRMTMQLLLAAMFPPQPSQVFQENLLWQPIPYNYVDRYNDTLISTYGLCHNLLLKSIKCQNDICKCNRDVMYKYLTKHSGVNVTSPSLAVYVEDTLRSEYENGLSLPDWALPIWPEPITTCALDFWRSCLANKTMVAVLGGNFVKKIIYDTKAKITNQNLQTRKLYLYTGHDHNIYLLLSMLEISFNFKTNYLAYFIFETHKINGVYGFKIYFDNQDGLGLKLIKIPWCETFCPLDEFQEGMKYYFTKGDCQTLKF